MIKKTYPNSTHYAVEEMLMFTKIGNNYEEVKQILEKWCRDKWF